MKKRNLNQRGETLAETLIALSILAIGITMASSSIINTLRNMTTAKNRIIAINITREGVEAMRNIRDTNWLLYSDLRRECWNNNPSITPCDGQNALLPGRYVVYRAEDDHWKLALADSDPNVDSDNDGTTDNDLDLAQMMLVDIDTAVDSDGDGTTNNDTDFYNHIKGIPDPSGTEVKSTPFKRFITIEYLDNDDTFAPISQLSKPTDSISSTDEWKTLGEQNVQQLNRMRVTSTVQWRSGEATHQTELKTILTDHLGRTELES